MSHFDWKLLRRKKVIPVERRFTGDETWTLASDQPFTPESLIKPAENSSDCSSQCDENNSDKNKKDDDDEFVDAVDICRGQEGRQSRTKKVKNYLRKCKGALTSSSSSAASTSRDESTNSRSINRGKNTQNIKQKKQQNHRTSSWYIIETKLPKNNDENAELNNDDGLKKSSSIIRTASLTRNFEDKIQKKNSPRRFGSESLLDSIEVTDKFPEIITNNCDDKSTNKNQEIKNEKIKKVYPIKDDKNNDNNEIKNQKISQVCQHQFTGRGDVASLVRSLLGPIYGEHVLDPLTRQARDILVCAYHGNIDNFIELYLSPAANLLEKLKTHIIENDDESLVPDGWPLTLSKRGLVLQLGELESSSLRQGESYLCVRSKNPLNTRNNEQESVIDIVEIALIWRSSMRNPVIVDCKIDIPKKSPTSTRRRRKKLNEENTNVLSPFKLPQSSSSSSQLNDNLLLNYKKLPTMIVEQQNKTSINNEETHLEIENLRKPIYLESMINNTKTLSSTDNYDNNNHDEFVNLISTLLITVERKIEKVSMDDLIFPCPACRNIDTDDPLLGCKCSGNEDNDGNNLGHNHDNCNCGNKPDKTMKTFEVDGFKHIDSDDEEEVRMGFGTKKRDEEVSPPRTIHDLSDRVLNCGLRLPGYADDASGRLVLEFENNSQDTREKICPREIASYLLYLSRLHSSDRTKNGWTLVIRGGNDQDLDTLDRALLLVQDRVHVRQALLLENETLKFHDSQFPRSSVKITSVDDDCLSRRFPRRRDDCYDQEHWIAFYKEYDSIMSEWQSWGRRLIMEMSELKESRVTGNSLTPLSRLLTDSSTIKTTRDANECLSCLDERSIPLLHLDYINCSLTRAKKLIEEVGNAGVRLENSFESRRATIRNLAVLRTIEEQATEVLSWICKKGEDVLAKHARHSATTLETARLHERDFEKFYFSSMRHLDKGSDLADAAGSSGLDDLSRSLRDHLRDFGLRLEDRREYLEETSRCCLLLERTQEWLIEAQNVLERISNQKYFGIRPPLPLPDEHFNEMSILSNKIGNESLHEKCKNVREKYSEIILLIRGGNNSNESPSSRRRSFATSESAAESNSWDDSDSNAGSLELKNTLINNNNNNNNGNNNNNNNNGIISDSRPQQLDNIDELNESQINDKIINNNDNKVIKDNNRRFVKPPVNSHLQRSPSIPTNGMKVKKTIILIMREMIQTERDYVKSLEYIIENYIPELIRDDIPQAMRGQRNVIFGNVEKIYEFHSQHFLRELEQCEHFPMMVGQCFLRHENKFYLYALYNKNKPNSDSLMAEYGTSFFKTKQIELGDKMDLASYLLKPVQRMGKYALLLQQLVKAGTDLNLHIDDKNDKNINNSKNDDDDDDNDGGGGGVKRIVEGEADLRSAEQMVRFQLRHGNDLLAMDSLRDCDVNVKEQGRLLRQNEFLVWQGKGKKCLRQVFLFEDLILFSKARRFPDRKNLDIYIYKHSIKTTDIGLTAVMADSPTKFEIWFRKRKPGDTYTLQCASEDIKKSWTEELSNLLWKQALRNREVRLAEMSSMGIGNKPCLDIRPSADQINDRSISAAQLSKTPRFRNSIAMSTSDDSSRCSRRPHSVISVSSSSSSGGSSAGPQTTLHLGLDASPRLHHRSTTLNSQCSVESGIIADISIVSDDGADTSERNNWKPTLESPTSPTKPNNTSTPLQSPTILHESNVASSSSGSSSSSSSSTTDVNLTPYDQDMSINL